MDAGDNPLTSIFAEIKIAESPRDCDPGSIYIDSIGPVTRAQVVGGKNDGWTCYATDTAPKPWGK